MEKKNKYAKKIAMLESQVRATDSHVNEEEEKKYAKKDCNAWITGESH